MKCSGKEWDTCKVEKMGCTGCHYSEAKEMFEELGFENETVFFSKQVCECVYAKYNSKSNACVRFYKDKTFEVTGTAITMELLRAICCKCRELGWT